MIDLKNIVVKFKQKDKELVAVDDVSVRVDKGDIYGIVGYSGAGKSTLVRVINLLQVPTSGEVIVDGKNLEKLSNKELREERKKIGMIFQHFNLMESRTIYQNVEFPLKGSGLTKEEERVKIERLLDLVGILDKKDYYPSQLSGGQKQRVAIARALANDPKILLCDEATSALDPKTTLSILELLREVNEALGITIVIITHEMQVVKEICNKVAVMEKGRVLEDGYVIDIFNEPRELLTQDFIRTATHIEQAEKKILTYNKDADIFELKFAGNNTVNPVIIELFKRFGITATILYGNIEYLQDTPFGTLLVSFDKQPDLAEVSDYLLSQNVKIEKLGGNK
ncbi:methionine ABC transporter ATP-binding protein [Floricoccus penangensis]|uniref:Methionine ABC transporter ATP-binding protein n=1 Tax=Floricoccus penangensis TaxID=1859475 RepID=A0A9Q5JGS7_9LACT|nr:ATP-binding cassette domain-containing protein [Floricoccus penangensis]OFI47076.1 methionine ABC transporter ATP-binding protein [Floricoccus penangensis]URZ87735.1 ATP-binding cassette domain-containing protein [Floricoccus penangensis]